MLEIYKMNEELNGQLRDIAEFTAQLGSEEGKMKGWIPVLFRGATVGSVNG